MLAENTRFLRTALGHDYEFGRMHPSSLARFLFNHEIILHVNEGVDGSLDYVKKNNFLFSYSEKNAGVCVAFNQAVKKATKKYIVLGHDDMYFCPNWDEVFYNELKKQGEDKDFFLSGTMVQPFESYINLDCGKTYKDFNEKKLLFELPHILNVAPAFFF